MPFACKALSRLSAAISLMAFLALPGCGLFSGKTDMGPAPASANKVVRAAYGQMGKKYRMGGCSPRKGFDCSGLVWWAYKQNGVKIPRITTDQARAGKSVPKKFARAGDIVVFKIGRSPRGLHTGLYAGDGRFIHSPGAGKKVRMDKLAPFWHKRLVAVRRIVHK